HDGGHRRWPDSPGGWVGVGDRTPCGLSLVGLPIPALRTGRARFRASGSPRSAHGENLFEPGVLVGVVYVDQTESGSGRVDLVGVPGVGDSLASVAVSHDGHPLWFVEGQIP